MDSTSQSFDEIFGYNLKLLREKAGMKQTDLAKNSGITQSAVSQVENGIKGMSLETVHKAAEALGVHPVALLSDRRYTESEAEIIIQFFHLLHHGQDSRFYTAIQGILNDYQRDL